MTKPLTKDNYAFVKIGQTEKQTLSTRLNQYLSGNINPSNIVYITTTIVKKREKLILYLFNNHPQLKVYKGKEYFEGPYNIMLNIFCYITLLDDCNLAKSINLAQINDIYVLIDSREYTIINIDNRNKNLDDHLTSKIITNELSIKSEDNNNDDLLSIDISEIICSKCGKQCKDKKGYSKHYNICQSSSEVSSFKCSSCDQEFLNQFSLNRHTTTCKVIKRQEEELKYSKLKEEYEAKYSKLKEEYEAKYIELEISYRQNNDRTNLLKERDNALSDLNDAKQLIAELQKEIKSDKQNILNLNGDLIDIARKALKQETIIQQNTKFYIRRFDPSLFQNKIVLPSRMIYNVSDLVSHLYDYGIGNMYRSSDRARKIVKWINEEGHEIKDVNCSQLCENALEAIRGDLSRQLLYQQERQTQLEQIEGSKDLDQLVNIKSNIEFCRKILNRDTKIITKLQNELSKHAKNKDDMSIDIPKVTIYN